MEAEPMKKFGLAQEPDFNVEAITREIQAAFAPYRSKRGSAVDELIALRRIEAWQETLEAIRGPDAD
jgi:hypothetical protein